MPAKKRKTEKDIRCPLEYGMDVFGGKWKTRVICSINSRSLRYRELKEVLPEVSDTMLAQCLKELTEEGIADRIQFDEIPPHVEYTLSEKGLALIPALQAICAWASEYYEDKPGVTFTRCAACPYREGPER